MRGLLTAIFLLVLGCDPRIDELLESEQFRPKLAGQALELDGRLGIELVDDRVATWLDQSNGKRHAVMGDLSKRPTLSAWPNGIRVPHFGMGSELEVSANIPGFEHGFTCVAILLPGPSDVSSRYIVRWGVGNAEYSLQLGPDGSVTPNTEGGGEVIPRLYVEMRPVLVSLRLTIDGERLLRVDGREVQRTGSPAPQFHPPGPQTVGTDLIGAMSYLTVYNQALSDPEISSIENWLKRVWACCG